MDGNSEERDLSLTIAILVEKAEGLLELRDLIVSQLIRHRSPLISSLCFPFLLEISEQREGVGEFQTNKGKLWV